MHIISSCHTICPSLILKIGFDELFQDESGAILDAEPGVATAMGAGAEETPPPLPAPKLDKHTCSELQQVCMHDTPMILP